MHMPDVHNCAQLGVENAALRKKVRRLKQQNMELLRDLNDLRDKQRMEAMKRQFVTSRNMEVQTDPPKTFNVCTHPQHQRKTDKPPENERVNKLLAMHNGLMRRYERELKSNMQHVETITNLNLKLNEMEQKFRESQMKLRQLEMEKTECQPRSRPQGHRRTASLSSEESPDLASLQQELRKVRKERDKLSQEVRKIRQELGGLDFGFFEEVEDLKFALQESSQLNQEYERSLRRVCRQFGVPYPHPEKGIKDPQPSTSGVS